MMAIHTLTKDISRPLSAVPVVCSLVSGTQFSGAEIRCLTNPLHLPKLFDCFVSTAVLLNDETLSASFAAFGRIRGLLYLSVHSVGSVSCEIISKCQCLSSIGSYNRATTMLDRWDGGFGSWAGLFFSPVHYFDKGWLSSTKQLPPTMPPVFSFFVMDVFAEAGLSFLFLMLTISLHLVNPPRLWSLSPVLVHRKHVLESTHTHTVVPHIQYDTFHVCQKWAPASSQVLGRKRGSVILQEMMPLGEISEEGLMQGHNV